MGCGASSPPAGPAAAVPRRRGRRDQMKQPRSLFAHSVQLASWVPPDDVPMMLSQWEQDKLWKAWAMETDANQDRSCAFRVCATELACNYEQTQFFTAVIDPSALTYTHACQLVGLMLHGAQAERTGGCEPHLRARVMFGAVDTDGDGEITAAELEKLVRLVGPKDTGSYDDTYFGALVASILNAAGSRTGTVTFDEWCDALPQVTLVLTQLAAEARKRGGAAKGKRGAALAKYAVSPVGNGAEGAGGRRGFFISGSGGRQQRSDSAASGGRDLSESAHSGGRKSQLSESANSGGRKSQLSESAHSGGRKSQLSDSAGSGGPPAARRGSRRRSATQPPPPTAARRPTPAPGSGWAKAKGVVATQRVLKAVKGGASPADAEALVRAGARAGGSERGRRYTDGVGGTAAATGAGARGARLITHARKGEGRWAQQTATVLPGGGKRLSNP